MSRNTTQVLLESGVITPAILASILGCSAPYIRRLCKNKIIKTFNISSTPGKQEFRIYASDAILFCRIKLSMHEENIPKLLLQAAANQHAHVNKLQSELAEQVEAKSTKYKKKPSDSGITTEMFDNMSTTTLDKNLIAKHSHVQESLPSPEEEPIQSCLQDIEFE